MSHAQPQAHAPCPALPPLACRSCLADTKARHFSPQVYAMLAHLAEVGARAGLGRGRAVSAGGKAACLRPGPTLRVPSSESTLPTPCAAPPCPAPQVVVRELEGSNMLRLQQLQLEEVQSSVHRLVRGLDCFSGGRGRWSARRLWCLQC